VSRTDFHKKDQFKKNKIGLACSTHGKDDTFYFFAEHEDHFEDHAGMEGYYSK
jgi:hypothetical protein